MRAFLAVAFAFLFGCLAGLMLGALLQASQAGLSPNKNLGLGLFWLSGVGAGVLVRAWSDGSKLWPRRLLSVVVLLVGIGALLPAVPVWRGHLGAGQIEFLRQCTDWFWDSGTSQAKEDAWRFALAGAGCLCGVLLRSHLPAWATGLALGLVSSGQSGLDPLESLPFVVALVVVLAWGSLELVPFFRARAAKRTVGNDIEAHDFGWSSEDLSVLRPRLGGLMLLSIFLVAAALGLIASDLSALSGQHFELKTLAAIALVFGAGSLLGKGLLTLVPCLARAELVPLFLLFGTSTWVAVSGGAEAVWPKLETLMLSRVLAQWPEAQALVAGTWPSLMMVGPVALAAGTAAVVLPALSFARSPEGARRSRWLAGAAVAAVGCLAWRPVESLAFTSLGPNFFLAGLVALAGISFFLVVDLRGQSIAPVKGRPSVFLCVLARCSVGIFFGYLAFDLASPEPAPLGFLGSRLSAELERSTGYVPDFEFALGDPKSARHQPWIEREDWVRNVAVRREVGGTLLDSQRRERLLASASQLACLLGNLEAPLVLDSRQQLFAKASGGSAAFESFGWALDLAAHGPDPKRAVSSVSYKALASFAGDKRFVCSWLPLELPEDRFQRGLDDFAACFRFASAWLIDGSVFLVGASDALELNPAEGAASQRLAASFVGLLDGPPEAGANRGDWALAAGMATSQGEPSSELERARRFARNLQRLLAGRTPFPMAWADLLGEDSEIAVGRALAQMRLAAAWVKYDSLAAPGSLALEAWEKRLDAARFDAGLLAPNDAELVSFDANLRAQNDLATARKLLKESKPRDAVGLLLSARAVLLGRGDLEILLAAAFDLAGNRNAARLTFEGLGSRGPALLRGQEAWLTQLGFKAPIANR